MGKLKLYNHTSLTTNQDSDRSIPLFLQVCTPGNQTLYKIENNYIINSCKLLIIG